MISQNVAAPRSTKATESASGGVSPKLHAPAMQGHDTAAPIGGPIATNSAFPTFSYHGGPVITCPLVYVSFWGDLWVTDPAHLARAGRLAQFNQDLLKSSFMNVLSQYGVGSGTTGFTGAFLRASFVGGVPTTLDETTINTTIQNLINAHVIPEPGATTNNILIIYLDESIGVQTGSIIMCEANNDDAFGYHTFFTTAANHPCYYAVIPGLSDACLRNSCANDNFCSLHLAQTQEQRVTQVTSHEFAEMVTDPQLNGWYAGDLGHENGDICNGESGTITVGSNTWTVQYTYSKWDDTNTNGASFCLLDAPTPRPKLTPGPASRAGATIIAERTPSYERVLPLPPIHYDLKTRKKTIQAAHVKDYSRQLFYPLHHEATMPDLPEFLRQVADALEQP